MTGLGGVSALAREFDDCGFNDLSELRRLVRVAQGYGLLQGVAFHSLAPDGPHDEPFLLTLEADAGLAISSGVLQRCDFVPPGSVRGEDAVSWVLTLVDARVHVLRAAVSVCGWGGVAGELSKIRKLLESQEAGTGTEESR
ncbi:hypothetical protein [Streptomyces candidus]|uniref:Uncharacterized protein n=1 Tax=Streptomyces candidus TaxID=67283 RepID=A0A7X0HG01_9ACTN|nr:hypothetical protein [Streptomyces candidus]MBB6436941.1 hypothetical protein [Streptomyces candidus]GHH32332.1 hypothetical protein GCM10018773_01230 [Streptomyces candidus]